MRFISDLKIRSSSIFDNSGINLLSMGPSFVSSLRSGDIRAIRAIPKSDLHNHCMMGARRILVQKAWGRPIAPFAGGRDGVAGINSWIGAALRPVLDTPGMFEKMVALAFRQAVSDGVTVLEMSMDVFFGKMFSIETERIVRTLRESHAELAPQVDFRPELGMARTIPLATLLKSLEPFLETGYFRAVDLYDIEDARPVSDFREIYRLARQAGMKCKAHAGEFGTAESVRGAVETLDLDAVQHGIGAADSSEVMQWLADRGTQLNVCPASNIALKRVRNYASHPLRILFDHGVKVTVNTDDVMLFNKGNSDQYLQFFRSGRFSAEELDIIRKNGLS
jgi:adenosine deaminase